MCKVCISRTTRLSKWKEGLPAKAVKALVKSGYDSESGITSKSLYLENIQEEFTIPKLNYIGGNLVIVDCPDCLGFHSESSEKLLNGFIQHAFSIPSVRRGGIWLAPYPFEEENLSLKEKECVKGEVVCVTRPSNTYILESFRDTKYVAIKCFIINTIIFLRMLAVYLFVLILKIKDR